MPQPPNPRHGLGAQVHDSPEPGGRFSCVVDQHPRFHLDALRWFACLTEVAGVDPHDLVVHVVGDDGSDALEYLRTRGVVLRTIARFDDRSPHCNKIAGALALSEVADDGVVVLCDTDLAVLEDPRRLALPRHGIAGKPVDAPVPPLETILGVFDAADVAAPPRVRLPWGQDQYTVSGNNNGGLYLVPGHLLTTVSSGWAHWARWLLGRIELLGEWPVYVDQVAMALALAAERIESKPLDVRWNTPSHDLTRIPPDAGTPAIIHYHQEVTDEGLLRTTTNEAIDKQIDVANEAIRRVWRSAAVFETHRQWLRRSGRVPADPRAPRTATAILAALVDALQPESILEVGNVDRGVTGGLSLERYSAIDGSPDALERAEQVRPGGHFFHGTLAQHPVTADVTISLGVLDLESGAGREEQVRRLWHSAGRALVVSERAERVGGGNERHPPRGEPLWRLLRRIAPGAEVYAVGEEMDDIFVVLRPPTARHPRDYLPTTLDPLMARHPDPLTLATIRIHAWRTLRFYPDHAPRLWEYPVAAQLITDELPAGSRLIDVGAGTTPLAPFLSRRGYVVDTVDPSPRRREWPPKDDWNEWDFLDYGSAGLAHRSWNTTVDKVPSRVRYDGAYSISVIEHVPAVDRRAMLAAIASRVRSGGLVVLTIDLARGSDSLWNRNLGVEVEDPSSHGTFDDVVDEGARVGLQLLRRATVRDWGDTNVDIGLMALRQVRGSRPGGGRPTRLGRRALRRLGRSSDPTS